VSSNLGSNNQKTEWVHCNCCLHRTKHSILAEHEKRVTEPYLEYVTLWWHTTYTLFICCGCESITLRRQMTFSEWESDELEIEFYPPQVSRQLPKWHDELPYEIHELLSEIYTALHLNSHRLALMGVRTIIDMFVLDKIGDIGTFQQKLKALVDGGYLGSQQKDILNVTLEAGSAAAHRGYKPSSEVLNHAVDVVESLLQSYALEKMSHSVKAKIPLRTKPSKPSL
jgi:Domain of unknown function (DUF4145)